MKNRDEQENYFSFDEWLPKFALDSNDAMTPSWLGPDHICFVELLRRQAGVYEACRTEECVTRRPSDVFVLGWGEGPTRHGTKVGGLPYLRKSDPWPCSKRTGNPLDFVCQFRFDESTDIVGPLPGDVLLVFCDLTDPSSEQFEWNFQWNHIGIDQSDLITEYYNESVPTCFGVRVRYEDFVSADVVEMMLETLQGIPQFCEHLINTGGDSLTETLNFIRSFAAQMCVLKIGGIPFWARPIETLVQQSNYGKFLAQIPPIIPNDPEGTETTYWINGVNIHEYRTLHWSPEGIIHLYLTNDNVVEGRFASLEPW